MRSLLLITIVMFIASTQGQDVSTKRQNANILPTATPRTPETVSRPSVLLRNSNPTLWTTCDYYFANWGSNRNPGTELRPFGLNWERIRKEFRGKLMCNINNNFGAVNGR